MWRDLSVFERRRELLHCRDTLKKVDIIFKEYFAFTSNYGIRFINLYSIIIQYFEEYLYY